MTGFLRDGDCRIGPNDVGRHGVCAQVTDAFLAFNKHPGNDLSPPIPSAGFPELKPGDRWCLCVDRWKEAEENVCAPPAILTATHSIVLNHIPLAQRMDSGHRERALFMMRFGHFQSQRSTQGASENKVWNSKPATSSGSMGYGAALTTTIGPEHRPAFSLCSG